VQVSVDHFTLTVDGLGGERVTVNTKWVVPELPSGPTESLMLSVGVWANTGVAARRSGTVSNPIGFMGGSFP
jgi:hypothetical protein